MDFTPSETHLAFRQMAHEFSQKEIHPVVEEIDQQKDPQKRFPSFLLAKGSRLGLRTLSMSEAKGGGGADPLTLCFVGEELGWGDLGLGMTFALDWCVSMAVERLSGEDAFSRLMSGFLEDDTAHLALVPISSGTSPRDRSPFDTGVTMQSAKVEQSGDHWVILGDAPHVVNGEVAKFYLTTIPVGEEGNLNLFFHPSELVERERVRFHDTMGMRSCQDVDLRFENVRIPKECRLISGKESLEKMVFSLFRILPCSAALGTARRAHETAVEHARNRVQGGKPIIGHQAVGFMLCESLAELNASRRLLQASAWALSQKGERDVKEDIMARVFISECCERIARRSMEVWGGAGYMTEAPMERYVRDMTSFMHSGEMTHSLRTRAMEIW